MRENKKIYKCLLMSFFLILFCSYPVSASSKNTTEDTIGIFKTGQNAKALASIGMPFPIDTGGRHSFIDSGDGVCITFSLERRVGNYYITDIELFDFNIVSRSFDEDHLLKTGFNISSYKTGKGIGLGDPLKKLLMVYGKNYKETSAGEIRLVNYHGFTAGIYRGKVVYLRVGR